MSPYRIAALVMAGFVALRGPESRGAEPPGRIGFRSYGTDAGIENHDIDWVIQDGEGFIWVGAADAVYRFDGERFERFGLEKETALKSMSVSDVTLDAQGRLLLATRSGVVRWEGNHFAPLPMHGISSLVSSLRLDSGKRMWVAAEQGLLREAEPGHFLPVPEWPGGPAQQLRVEASGALQVASGSRLVSRDVHGRWRVQEVPGQKSITDLVRDGGGRLWLSGEGWLMVQPKEGAPLEDRTHLIRGAMGAGRRLRVGNQGQLLVPNYRGLLEVKGEHAEYLQFGLSERSGRMKDVLEDSQGTLWIASLGVHRSLGRGLWTVHDTGNGLPSSMIWGLTRGPDGKMWVGTDKGLAHGTPGGWVPYPPLAGYSLKAVSVDRDGVVWTAGNPAGLHRYEPWSGKLRTFGEAAGYTPRYTFDLQWEPDGTLWASTTHGLIRGVRTGEDWSFELVLPSKRMASMGVELDGAGRLWATTGDGLYVREGGVFRRLDVTEGLRDNRVRYLFIRRDGRVCVSYAEPLGLSCFSYRDGHLTEPFHMDRGTGLHNGVVYQLGEDMAGRLWVGTGAGVHILGVDGVLEHFGASGGAPGDDFSGNSFLADPDGTVWVGTSNGLGRFESARYTGLAQPPRVALL
ncbi:ligand-binding sensor domain-containing protein, partial [Archangium sp.]|uniref:ligand-binding sensor domain-containing protein n=1 Tax=Archangium sp. TaxID=1872627 RepID=UPI002ED90E3A